MSKHKTAPRRPWPPPAAALPDSIEQIEAGRPGRQAEPLDHSKAGRLARLLGTVPGIHTAAGMTTVAVTLFALAGMLWLDRQREQLEQARRFVAEVDRDLALLAAIRQQAQGEHDQAQRNREPWATDPDAWKE